MIVVIAGGGTAGHVFPGLALGNALRAAGHEVRFLGTDRGQEVTLVPAAGFALDTVPVTPFVRSFSPAALRAPFAALRSVRACRPLVRDADVVVGMGGYASVSAVLAARREGRSVVVHEQNAVAGLANRLAGRFARAVALSFAEARRFFPRRARVEVTGNPVREPVLDVPRRRGSLAAEARDALGLERGRRTILLFGGSQGALRLDRAAVGAARLLANRGDLQLLALTGRAHHDAVAEAMPRGTDLLIRTVPFLDRMELAYAVADLALSRAGATTVAEITVCGIPALLVPYPYATGRHQEANARALQRAGGASVLLDDQVTAATLAARLEDLIGFDERLEAMRAASERFGKPDAADRLAAVVAGAAVDREAVGGFGGDR